jgi:hypothetical protein
MWTHASAEEQQVSRDLRANNAQTLPAIIGATVPAEPKTKDDPAPARDPAPVGGPTPVRDATPAVEARGDEGEVDDTEPSAKKARGNTTMFPYWPDPYTINDRLPEDGISEDKELLRQEWLAKELLHPDRAAEERRWHGVHVLGEGAMGRVGLWVHVNADRLTSSNSGLQSEM